MDNPPASGLWGLIHQDGSPIGSAEIASFGTDRRQTDCAVLARDSLDSQLVDEVEDRDGQTILAGWIADRTGLAQQMNLPSATPPALLARAALRRFGTDTPAEMLGEWSLFHRNGGGDRTVWLMLAATRRDRLFFSVKSQRLAFAPTAMALAKIDWVGRDIESEALVLSLGGSQLRERLGWRSILRGIEQIPPGGSLQFRADSTIVRHCANALTLQPGFVGDPDDAIEALKAMLKTVVRERLAVGQSAILLSGGLDSSLLAGFAAAELDRPPIALCSVAPASSAAKDEFAFAQAVASKAEIRLEPVHPPPEADPYLPSPAVLAAAESPLLSNRHCLTTCFQEAARKLGATMLVNGTYGEMSVTARLRPMSGLRSWLGAARRIAATTIQPDHARFHVRLAPHRIIRSAATLRDAWRDELQFRDPLDPAGYMLGTAKALAQPNAYYPGALRMDFPFRDLRLLRLFATMSRSQLQASDPDRGAARRMALGILPQAVLQRRSGMPADPGHYDRLKRFAPIARARIGLYREAQIDDWLDLDWLERELARVAIHGAKDVIDANSVQLTALAAEYIRWMQSDPA
jgi:asparagine synthase (glutamine-hydrolysing)